MDKRKVGPLEISIVGLGGNNFGKRLDVKDTAQVVHAAIDAGINFFDTSDNYGDARSEEYLGLALQGRRSQAVIATKFGSRLDDARPGGARPDYIRQAVEGSLRRLKIDCIDLYQMHRAPEPDVPLADTLGALDELVVAGKVRAVGCSNFSAAHLAAAAEVAADRTRFVSVQNQYSLLHRDPERDVIPECLRLDMAFIPYSPLAGGMLSGKYRLGQPMPEGRLNEALYERFVTQRNFVLAEALLDFVNARGRTLLELAFSWLVSRPALASVIAGATRPEQVQSNVAAIGWKLSEADLAEIDAILGIPALAS